MPLPKPTDNETKSRFINRCMADPVMTREFKDASQRRGICEAQWQGETRMSTSKHPEYLTMIATPTIEATAEGDDNQLPRFSMVAYTGGTMRIDGFPHPVVVDLAGLEIPNQNLPIRLDHQRRQGVGHTRRVAVEDDHIVRLPGGHGGVVHGVELIGRADLQRPQRARPKRRRQRQVARRHQQRR